MSEAERQLMASNDPEGYRSLREGSMRLGLDLQGGMHAIVRVKLEDIPNAARAGAVERAKEVIRNRIGNVFEFHSHDSVHASRTMSNGLASVSRQLSLAGEEKRLEFTQLALKPTGVS